MQKPDGKKKIVADTLRKLKGWMTDEEYLYARRFLGEYIGEKRSDHSGSLYIKTCPVCRKDDHVKTLHDDTRSSCGNGNKAFRILKCKRCNAVWREVYRISGIQILEPIDESDERKSNDTTN